MLLISLPVFLWMSLIHWTSYIPIRLKPINTSLNYNLTVSEMYNEKIIIFLLNIIFFHAYLANEEKIYDKFSY